MISVSSQYKDIMTRYKRNKSYISVGIGIIDQEAQASAQASAETAYWSKGNIFNSNQSRIEYATLEENQNKADGKMLFLPENNELMQLLNNGIVTDAVRGSVRIDFPQLYSIKGITLVFGSAYPTEFTVKTVEKTLTYTNNSERFFTYDVLGDTDYIIITPSEMVGGEQRFRLQSVLMGVGLSYTNEQTKSFKHSEEVSTISEELPKESTNFSFYDEENLFDVNDDNSFIDFLETMQKVTISFGLELDDGTVEWHQVATNYLKTWKSQKGVVTLTATDRLSQMKDKYEIGNKIYTRTAYEEAESIFADAGIQPDEYFIDDYLNDVILTNPMPKGTHKQSLQLLANACRCAIRQDAYGKIMIIANFAVVIDPEDLTVSTNGHTKWSKPDNILIGSDIVYGDLTKNFLKADGVMYFLPENESYLETSYVSEQVADGNGIFDKNLLKNTATSQTINGVEFLINDDGSVTVNGTASAQSVLALQNGIELKKGTYVLSGCPLGSMTGDGTLKNYGINFRDNDNEKSKYNVIDGLKSSWDYVVGYSAVEDLVFEVLEDVHNTRSSIVIQKGTTVENLTFYPMIRPASNTDESYQPYQENPTIKIQMPAAYTYFGVNVEFDGNPPQEMKILTYNSDSLVGSVVFKDLQKKNNLIHEFKRFDRMVFEFTKGYPLNRVLVNKISFGALSDYVLTTRDMMKNPVGYKEERVKAVRTKIYTYENDQNGKPQEVKDEVYVERLVSGVGVVKTLSNPLISTQEHAELLAEWMGNYYANNIYYTVNYRGRPDVNATDVIHMESDKKNNIQVEVGKNDISFNGAFSGKFELRRAVKMIGG